MDPKALKPYTEEELKEFTENLKKLDWVGIKRWHQAVSPWLNEESIDKFIDIYKKELDILKI